MDGECALPPPCSCELDTAATLRLLLPRSPMGKASVTAIVALVLVLEVVGALTVYRMGKKWRRQSNRARREARRLANKPPASATPDEQLIVDKQLRSEFFMEPSKNGDWQIVRAEDFSHVPIPNDWDGSLANLQRRIGVRFKDVRHLKCALIHHGVLSGMHLPRHIPVHRLSNRSMEFLGDSVLAMAVASYIFQAQPMHREGKMTRVKDMLVNNQTLSKVCVEDLEMDEVVVVDPNISARQKGNTSPMYLKGRVTIEAGSVEALIAAIYLDQGLECALDFVNHHVLPHAIRYAAQEVVWDPTLELQKLLQAHRMGHPVYENVPTLTRTGNEVRSVDLVVQGERVLTAKGTSYKTARRQAAETGYHHYLKVLGPLPPT